MGHRAVRQRGRRAVRGDAHRRRTRADHHPHGRRHPSETWLKAGREAGGNGDPALRRGRKLVVQIVETFGSDMDDETRANLEPLSAVGFAMWGEGDQAEFTLRLTTK